MFRVYHCLTLTFLHLQLWIKLKKIRGIRNRLVKLDEMSKGFELLYEKEVRKDIFDSLHSYYIYKFFHSLLIVKRIAQY